MIPLVEISDNIPEEDTYYDVIEPKDNGNKDETYFIKKTWTKQRERYLWQKGDNWTSLNKTLGYESKPKVDIVFDLYYLEVDEELIPCMELVNFLKNIMVKLIAYEYAFSLEILGFLLGAQLSYINFFSMRHRKHRCVL